MVSDRGPAKHRLVLIVPAVLLLVLLTVTLVFVIARQRSKFIVREQIRSLQAAGDPTSTAELNEYYVRSIEADELATDPRIASDWLRAIAFVESPAFVEAVKDVPTLGVNASIPPPSEDWPEQAQVEELFDAYSTEIATLRRLPIQLGPVRYPSNFAIPDQTIAHEISEVRSVARLLALDVQLAARNGDQQRYTDSLRCLMGISNSLRCEPTMIGMLIRMAVESAATHTVQQTVQGIKLSTAQTQTLVEAFGARNHLRHLQLSLRGERALAITMFLEMGPQFPTALPVSLPVRYGDLSFYLDVVERLHTAALGGFPDAWMATQREQDSTASMATPTKYFRMLSLLSLPALEASVKAAMRTEFQTNACQVAFAMQAYRNQHGAYPEQLQELVPDFLPQLPLDPYNGETVRLRLTPDGFRIYSVGPDLLDGGGRSEDQNEPSDLVFQVPAPLAESP